MNPHQFDFENQHFDKEQIVSIEVVGNRLRLHELNGNVHTFLFKSEEDANKHFKSVEKHFVEEDEKPKVKPKAKKAE